MKNIECINLKYKGLIVNQDKYENKIERSI